MECINNTFNHRKHPCILEHLETMTAARNSSYKLKDMVTLLYRYRGSSSPSLSQSYHHDNFSYKLGYGGYMNHQGLRLISGSSRDAHDHGKPEFDMVKDVQPLAPPAPSSPQPGISAWVKWILGSVLAILLPFWKQKWERLRSLEGEMEKVVGEVEGVAEVVEKMATVAEKVSAEVADQLPDNSIIKEAALVVEHISNVTAADAELTQNFIHKVEDVKQDFKDLETMAEPVIDNIIKTEVKPNQKEQLQ